MTERKDCIAELVAKSGRPRAEVEDILNQMFEWAEERKWEGNWEGNSLPERLEGARDEMLSQIRDGAAFERLRIIRSAKLQLDRRLAASGPMDMPVRIVRAAAAMLPIPRIVKAAIAKLPVPETLDALFDFNLRRGRDRAFVLPDVRRALPDWKSLNDGQYPYEDPLLVAASREAEKTPELVSVDPDKSVNAAQAAAKDATALLGDMLPQLSDRERQVFEEAFQQIKGDKESSEQIARLGAACLAEAAI